MSRYPKDLTIPMAKDLTDFGFKSLETPEAVEDVLKNNKGMSLLVINSVCGCAAANARPAAKLSLSSPNAPENLFTVFAGVDMEATAKARQLMMPYPPSSPSMALFKDNKLVHFIERHHIEGQSVQNIAKNLVQAFDHFSDKVES